MRPLLGASLLLFLLTPHFLAQANPLGLKIPTGFEIVEFADNKLANDIVCMTVDPKGRVVVSGRGYVRVFVDDNGDGKADRALDFASEPKDGAMGLLWEGDTLFAMGDGGLRHFTSMNGDKADGPSKLIRKMKTGGEHAAHAIRRGPDGWLYVLCGNNTGIDKSYADLPTSPIKEPTAGCVLRFRPDSPRPLGEGAGVMGCEIVAHGFRNPYGMDFNLDGELFTYDSDNERCVSLPWYEPTRFYHVIEGRHYGWLNPQHAAFWRRPPYFVDAVAPVATLGRGSPTGVACYRHNQFPTEYHGGFFLCDWTFGKIYFVKLERKGASYRAEPRVFLESLGENGFAPTACAVDEKTGDLYVSIGGRGTRGGVYRIRHPERFAKLATGLAPLPMANRSLEWNVVTKKEYETKYWSKVEADHLRALQMARRQNWLVGEKGISSPFSNPHYFDDLSIRLASADLIDDLLQTAPARVVDAFKKALKNRLELSQATTFGMGIVRSDRAGARDSGLALLSQSKLAERRLEGVRLIQLSLGDVGARNSIGTIWEGYAPREETSDAKLAAQLAAAFPSRHADLDRELARMLGMLGHDDANLRSRLLATCTADSSPLDDIHFLACYARLSGQRAAKETQAVAAALLDLDRKLVARKLHRDSNWPLRVRELYVGLVEKDAMLHATMVEHPAFGRADHALFATVKGFSNAKAGRIFLNRWQRDKGFALSGNVVQLFETLPPTDVLPIVRERWGQSGQESSFLPMLAKKPERGDRGKFIDGLNSPQSAIVAACVQGLEKLDAKADASEVFALIRALHRTQGGTGKPAPHGARLAGRLEKITGQMFASDSNRWIAWLQKQHPEFGTRLANPDGVDVAKWEQRLARLDWDTGDGRAGQAVYSKASCVHCHSGSQALGPDLVGVAKRFSRADLFTAIWQPSKDVPARYQTTVVETNSGKTHQGIVIYDAVDSLILQTGAAMTVRLDGQSVVSRQFSTQSLMPAGLLDGLSDREIVDLYAYLRSLQ